MHDGYFLLITWNIIIKAFILRVIMLSTLRRRRVDLGVSGVGAQLVQAGQAGRRGWHTWPNFIEIH